MTFEQFQATCQPTDDIARDLPDAAAFFESYAEPAKGRIYAGGLFIEGVEGDWLLTICNTSVRSSDLAKLERDLFDYATSEGYFE